MVIFLPNLQGMCMAIKESTYYLISQAVTRAQELDLKAARLELKREKEALQSRVSLIAELGLKPLTERVEWSKTASSGGSNLVSESFIKAYSLNSDLITFPYSRSAAIAELNAGNQWLELRAPHTQETPLVLFLKKVGLLDSEGKTRSDRPALNRNIALKNSLDLLEDLLEQEKKACDLEGFTFSYDDLGELECQMQSLAYKKLTWFLSKFVKKDPIVEGLKVTLKGDESEEKKILQCKTALKNYPDHLFSRILSSLFSSSTHIEAKAKEMFFKASRFVKASDLQWDPSVSIADQWIWLRAFQDEVSKVVSFESQNILKDFEGWALKDLPTKDLKDLQAILKGENYQELLGPRIDSLRSSIPSLEEPSNTLYGKFSQFHEGLTRKYEDIITRTSPIHRRLADLSYENYDATALNSLNISRTLSETEVAAANKEAVDSFALVHLGKSKALYPSLLHAWNKKMDGLWNDKASPFYVFLESRGFFSESSQEMCLSLKVSRFMMYQALFCILINVAAEKLGISVAVEGNESSATSDCARRVTFACFLQAASHMGSGFLAQMNSLGGSSKEKIEQAKSILSKMDHPDKEALLMILTGSFIGDYEVEPVVREAFSCDEEVIANPVIKAFIKAMNIEDRAEASYDENYFEQGEAFIKFKNYLIERVRGDPKFTGQLKQLKDYELTAFADLLSTKSKAIEWIRDMQNQINDDAKWLKEKARIYDLPELAEALSQPLTGHKKMIVLNKGFNLLQGKLKKAIVDHRMLSVLEGFVEESCLHQNTKALDHVIQKMGILNELD